MVKVELIAELRSRIALVEDNHRTSERELDELRAVSNLFQSSYRLSRVR